MFRIISLKCKHNDFIQIAKQSTVAATTIAASDKIKIPKRINRGPTDLLYSLSRTIGRDPTAKGYKFHDDPFLLPKSYADREIFGLAQESGKRTAQWIRNEHASLFNSTEAEPTIEAYLPKAIFTEKSDVDIETLRAAIDAINVSDAELVYKLLIAKKIPVPDDLKQDLLELVSFYNHKNPLPFDMFEEREAAANAKRKPEEFTGAVDWQENCLADQLFHSMNPKSAAAYNTVIRALYKYNATRRAEGLYKEAKENKIPLDLATYNVHIANLHLVAVGLSIEQRWEEVKLILKEMNNLQMKPNVHTLNAILSMIRSGGNFARMPEYAQLAMAEFERLNVEPCLATYWYLLSIYYVNRATFDPTPLASILERLEKSPDFVAQSLRDSSFFIKAIGVCRYNLKNPSDLVRRIDRLVTHGDNIKFLGDSKQEQSYYRNLLFVILSNEPFDEFIKIYDHLVPDIYSVEPSIVEAILSVINATAAIEFIPKFWSDMVICNLSRRQRLTDILLKIMCDNPPLDDIEKHIGLSERFADIATTIYEDQVNGELRNARNVLMHANPLSQIIIITLRANRFDLAKTVVERCLNQKKGNIVGALTEQAIITFTDACITNNEPRIAIKVIEYSIELGINGSVKCARKLVQSLTLNQNEKKRLADLVGQDVLRSVEDGENK